MGLLEIFFSYIYAKIKIDSDNDLPLEQTLTLHSAIILIRSVSNKDPITTTVLYSYKNAKK